MVAEEGMKKVEKPHTEVNTKIMIFLMCYVLRSLYTFSRRDG